MSLVWLVVIWVVITIVFIVLEFLSDKYFLPVAMGAGVAAIATLFSLPILGQIIAFVVVTILGYVLFRPNKPIDGRKKRRNSKRYDDDYDD